MEGPTNAVLAERINQIKDDLNEFKIQTREEIKELNAEVEKARRIADEVHNSTKYVRESVNKMERMMESFIGVVNKQNDKIDDFINSDKRRDSKKQIIISSLQVISGIVLGVLGFLFAGKM